MKVVIVPDSFKDCMTAVEVARHIEIGILKVFPQTECMKIPMADGGEGTIESIRFSVGGEIIKARVLDPLMRETEGFYSLIDGGLTGIVEMASASGLELLTAEERNPLHTSTFGTGQLIKEVLNKGIKKLIIGLGGSATNDGGAGMVAALGVKFLDHNGDKFIPTGSSLCKISKIDTIDLEKRLQQIEIVIATDVTNILCGPFGASAVFGPQKGATEEMVAELDRNLFHYGKMIEANFGKKLMDLPGSGAAGGMGLSLLAFSNATIRSGFEVISEIINLENFIRETDLVITGEGRLDRQTDYGKTPAGVVKIAKKYNKPVIIIAGAMEENLAGSGTHNYVIEMPIVEKPCSLEYAIKNAPALIENSASRIIKMVALNV